MGRNNFIPLPELTAKENELLLDGIHIDKIPLKEGYFTVVDFWADGYVFIKFGSPMPDSQRPFKNMEKKEEKMKREGILKMLPDRLIFCNKSKKPNHHGKSN
jgi:hypothetical protein